MLGGKKWLTSLSSGLLKKCHRLSLAYRTYSYKKYRYSYIPLFHPERLPKLMGWSQLDPAKSQPTHSLPSLTKDDFYSQHTKDDFLSGKSKLSSIIVLMTYPVSE
jgi:hypothetical protein